jgi:hypothetical protein
MNFEDYRSHKGYGSSFLNRVLISPAHAKVGVEPSPAMKMGTFLHDVILKHEVHNLSNVEEQLVAAKVYSRGEALKRAAANVLGATEALRAHSLARRLLWHTTHEYEKSVFTQINDLNIKCRPDLVSHNDKMIIDLKTSNSAGVEDFTKKVFNRELGYCVQAALYLDVMNIVTPGAPFKVFCWVVVELDAPFPVNVFFANEETLDIGRQRYLKAIDIVKECERTGMWPGYEEKINLIEKPKWVTE